MSGIGNNANEAWDEATEQFAQDPGSTPEPDEYTTEPFDEED